MIRDAATQAQVDAADPKISTWLSANAGSGKTRVLTDRVARLLLDGVSPQNILCLTYTKAAASEMQNRLFRRLGDWAMKPTEDLAAELRQLGVGGSLDAERLNDARRLFARAIETPGGLRIQTIHSFCAGLLRRFPLEAGISPQFRELEDRAADLMRAEVIEDLSLTRPDLVRGLVRYVSDDDTLSALLREIAAQRGALRTDAGGWRAALGLDDRIDETALLGRIVLPGDRAMLRDVEILAAAGTSNDLKLAARMNALPDVLAFDDLESLESLLLYKSGPREWMAKGSATLTNATKGQAADHLDALDALALRVEIGRQDRCRLAALRRTETLHAFAGPFLAGYEARKLAGGWLDFDDQIGLANALLNDPRVAAWVLYRLDGGIDHILVDEAQDTGPGQWGVIRALAQEFASGDGARAGEERTIFVVGDKKQSIYSFQGADPEAFDRMCAHFEGNLRAAGMPFREAVLEYSFRSSEAILRAVDAIFARDDLGIGQTRHLAFKDLMPGRVDLWPLVEKTTEPDDEPEWFDPVDRVSAQDPRVVLAESIARRLRDMIDREETIPAEIGNSGVYGRRRITEGDILVLVRKRGIEARVSLFYEIIAACKKAGLRVAGADRLRVGAELAVKDIAALLRFLALPEDDLSLAEALRSPLFGLSEAQLYALAQPRGNRLLWQALREDGNHPGAMAIIDDLLRESDYLRPFDLINRILTRHDGRRRLLARLGAEAEDGIDALLAQALSYERSEVPGLTGFLEWMETDDLEIKRQSESAGDRIRVMSVHGAKGLEAPIVILPETEQRTINPKNRLYTADSHVFYAPPSAEMPDAIMAARDARKAIEEREDRRLLYVAMTRARSWLIVCGHGSTGKDNNSWHGLVAAGMEHLGTIDADFPTGPGRRYQLGDWEGGDIVAGPAAPTQPRAMAPLPIIDAGVPIDAPRAPSDLGGDKIIAGDPAEMDREGAMTRGSMMHLLLEHLPGIAPDARHGMGMRILAGCDADMLPQEQAAMIGDALRLIEAPDLKDIFAAGMTEVDITGDIPGLGRLHGAIDRLIVTDASITAIDYKSNRLVPASPEMVPEGLLRQMAAYRALLSSVWPGRRIDVALLWTATGTLMHLPEPVTDAALARAMTKTDR